MGMPIRSFMALIAAATPAVSAAAADKAWPDRTVRIVIGSAGSSPDAAAGTLTDAFTKRWNHQNFAPCSTSSARNGQP
jgi:tripartite-type tricarboxylate transporter receptor subunit TctC